MKHLKGGAGSIHSNVKVAGKNDLVSSSRGPKQSCALSVDTKSKMKTNKNCFKDPKPRFHLGQKVYFVSDKQISCEEITGIHLNKISLPLQMSTTVIMYTFQKTPTDMIPATIEEKNVYADLEEVSVKMHEQVDFIISKRKTLEEITKKKNEQ